MIRYPHTLRPAFSMLTAIFVIVMMAMVTSLVMSLAGKTVQETTTQYRKEQAILLAKSYTEYAIMAATARNCVADTISGSALAGAGDVKKGLGYHVDITLRYIGATPGAIGDPNFTCDNAQNINRGAGDIITYPPSQGAILLIDVFVRYRDPDSLNAIAGANWTITNRGITYHKRTLARL